MLGRVNLLLASSNTGCNGAVMYARRIAPRLAARGHRVWVAASRDSWIAREVAGEVSLFETRFLRWPFAELDRVAAFCRRERIDVFHSHLTRASNFGALLRMRHGIPSLAHLHANHLQAHGWFHDRVLAVSADTLRRHRARLVGWGEDGAVLPNFVDTTVFRPRHGRADALRPAAGLAPGTPVVVVVGTLCARKGQDLAARAWPAVRASHPDARLVLIGPGALPRELASTPGVVLLGHRDDVAELLPHATVCLVPSRDEPFGLAAVEAMACGVPVVAASVGGLAEIVSPGAGLTFAAGDLRALTEAIHRILCDHTLQATLSEAGMSLVADRYAPGPHLAALERHYADLSSQA